MMERDGTLGDDPVMFSWGWGGGGWWVTTKSNPKSQVLPKFHLGGGTPDQLKSKEPTPDQVFIVGEGVLWTSHSSNT